MGACLSSLTRPSSRAKDPDKARERKVFFTAIGGVLAVIFLLCAIFIPGPDKIKDMNVLIFFLIAFAVFFLAFRFKKAAGIPVVLLAAGFIVAVFLFLQALVAYTGETEIARIKVLSVEKNVMKFELTDAKGTNTELEMPGTLLGVEVKEVIFSDFFVFFGAKTAYRLVGLKSAEIKKGSELTQELRAYEFARPSGISETLYQFVSANQNIIPGIKAVQIQITYVEVKPSANYSVRVQHDSGTEIMKVKMAPK
jgi:hypothetical protein